MTDDINFAEIRKIRSIADKFLGHLGCFNILWRNGKALPPFFAFFPEQRLIQYQAGCTWIFFHGYFSFYAFRSDSA